MLIQMIQSNQVVYSPFFTCDTRQGKIHSSDQTQIPSSPSIQSANPDVEGNSIERTTRILKLLPEDSVFFNPSFVRKDDVLNVPHSLLEKEEVDIPILELSNS